MRSISRRIQLGLAIFIVMLSIFFNYFLFSFDFKEDLENLWASIGAQASSTLSADTLNVPEEEHPLPFDATSDKSMDEQK